MEVDGKEVLRNLEEIKAKLQKRVKSAMEEVCLKVQGDAMRNCPADNGTLRQSIMYDVAADSDGSIGEVGTMLEYAPYVHEGTGIYARSGNGRKQVPWVYRDAAGNYHSTKGQTPKPFLSDAIDANRDTVMTFFEGLINE